MAADDQLTRSLEQVRELEAFSRALILHIVRRKVRPAHGEDLTKYAQDAGQEVPEILRGEPITWESRQDDADEAAVGKDAALVLVGPGHPEALGLTVGCIRRGKWKICLECGWLYCRIVITRRF